MTSHHPPSDDVSSAPNEWVVEIITPDGTHLNPTATLVELTSADGQIGVMSGHERLITVLDVGELVIHNGLRRDVFLVSGGFARVSPDRLSVLAFSLERVSDSAALARSDARRRELLGDADLNQVN